MSNASTVYSFINSKGYKYSSVSYNEFEEIDISDCNDVRSLMERYLEKGVPFYFTTFPNGQMFKDFVFIDLSDPKQFRAIIKSNSTGLGLNGNLKPTFSNGFSNTGLIELNIDYNKIGLVCRMIVSRGTGLMKDLEINYPDIYNFWANRNKLDVVNLPYKMAGINDLK